MDFTPYLSQLRTDHALAASQLAQMSQVYCLGSRLLLSAVVRAAPRPERILGAVTTAEEGWAKVVRHQPDLLVVSEGLEAGCGVELTLRVKRDHPRTRVLLLVSRKASRSRAREAIAAGCDGVLRDAGLGAGGELAAIRTIYHGGQVIDRPLLHPEGSRIGVLSQHLHRLMTAVECVGGDGPTGGRRRVVGLPGHERRRAHPARFHHHRRQIDVPPLQVNRHAQVEKQILGLLGLPIVAGDNRGHPVRLGKCEAREHVGLLRHRVEHRVRIGAHTNGVLLGSIGAGLDACEHAYCRATLLADGSSPDLKDLETRIVSHPYTSST